MIKRLFFLIIILNNVFAQADMTEGYRPRNLTRGKMWSSYRNNGLDGGGNRSKSDSHSQESLTYPGNMSRVALDFIEYFIEKSCKVNVLLPVGGSIANELKRKNINFLAWSFSSEISRIESIFFQKSILHP